jgi:hypothetical protein
VNNTSDFSKGGGGKEVKREEVKGKGKRKRGKNWGLFFVEDWFEGREGSADCISICIYTYVVFQQLGFWRSALLEGGRVKKRRRAYSVERVVAEKE